MKESKKTGLRDCFLAVGIILAVIAISFLIFPRIFGANTSAKDQRDSIERHSFDTTSLKYKATVKPDTEGDKRIKELPPYDKNDTWAIYIYMCGSDLESTEEDELSTISKILSSHEVKKIQSKMEETEKKRLFDFITELRAEEMDLPNTFYLPKRSNPIIYTEEEYADYIELEDFDITIGAATNDIKEIKAVEMSQNVKVIIQTGGSKKWYNPMVNPNKIQRFMYDIDGFFKIDESPLANMGDKQTLIDFLNFCEKHPADHKILIFWNHGDGDQGVCADEIFGYDKIDFSEMKEAFATVYGATLKKVPFEVLGFDACLMATTDGLVNIQGYANYVVASAEIEPATGWSYEAWLNALNKNPGMNGAQLGKEITDSFIEYYTEKNLTEADSTLLEIIGLSVIDLKKLEKVSSAYHNFSKEALKKVIENPSSITAISSAAKNSIRYGNDAYNQFNSIDLKVFMENLKEEYPKETKEVLSALKEAIIYTRANYYLSEAGGISIYFPTEINSYEGLERFLAYQNTICPNNDVKALYYYKVAGCLNKELSAYVKKCNYGEAKKLDTKSLNQFSLSSVKIEQNKNFSVQLPKEVFNLLQARYLSIARYDKNTKKVFYYGRTNDVLANNKDGELTTNFLGSWLCINGVPLFIDEISRDNNFIRYRSPILLNGKKQNLFLVESRADEHVNIVGISDMQTGDTIGRTTVDITNGDEIKPIYQVNCLKEETQSIITTEEYGRSVYYNDNCKIKYQPLSTGTYFASITIQDVLSNEFYSPVVELYIENGKVKRAIENKNLTSVD